jgi:hypothetical protein
MKFPHPVKQLHIGRGFAVTGQGQLRIWIRPQGYMPGSFVPSYDQRIFPISYRWHNFLSASKTLEPDLWI